MKNKYEPWEAEFKVGTVAVEFSSLEIEMLLPKKKKKKFKTVLKSSGEGIFINESLLPDIILGIQLK